MANKHKLCHCGSTGDFTCCNCGKGVCDRHIGTWHKLDQKDHGVTLHACPECKESSNG